MKILYYVAVYQDFTGSHRAIALLASRLPSRFETVFVLPADGPARAGFEKMGLRTIVVPTPQALNQFEKRLLHAGKARQALVFARDVLPYTLRLRRVIRAERADIVHCNDSRAVLLAGWAARLAGTPVIWHLHGENQLVGHPFLDRATHALSTMVVPCAHALERGLRRKERVRVIHYAVDPEVHLSSPEAQLEMRALLAARGFDAESAVQVVSASLLVPFKGHHHVVTALHRLTSRRPDLRERVAWIVLGDATAEQRSRYASFLRDEAERLGVDRNLFFIGWRDDAFPYLAAADVVLLPTVQAERFTYPDGETLDLVCTEGVPFVVLEAMLAGRAVVASRVAGVPEAITDGVSGRLVEPGAPDAIAAALEELVDDPTMRSRLGAAARQDVSRFSVDAMTRAAVELYEELVR